MMAETHSDEWYARLHRVPRARARLRDPAHPRARRRRRPRQALGHAPQRGLQRDPRLLRAALLVRVAGHDPGPRADLAVATTPPPAPAPRELLDEGAVFAFGLSEREHGADIYETDMLLTPDGEGFRANGGKYYIGNGNVAGMVSVFGRRPTSRAPTATSSSPPTPATPPTCCAATWSRRRCT